jgi:N-acetylglucosaminyldiphosphoundecaprenol N-acetyl-beta-D-mannosaminyltransferase
MGSEGSLITVITQAETPADALARIPRVDVLGVKISAINMAEAVRLADLAVASGRPRYICVTGVHGVMEAQSDPQIRQILNEAVLNTPDGMPMSWVGWMNGFRGMDRVYGPDFMLEVCQLSVKRGYTQFLLGGKSGVADALKNRLESQFPGLRFTGTFTPPFRPLAEDEEEMLVSMIGRAKPDIIWVGLSTPKQERFMARYCTRLGVPLMIGVGAAFDIHTGLVRDAPNWVKRSGLQWLHRMTQEPQRLAPRYLQNNPRFLLLITRELVRRGFERFTGNRSSTISPS